MELDPFDKLYSRWANIALDKKLDPPSRERWDATVLFLLMSKDPERVRTYKDIRLGRGENLGSDAFDLWKKMPDYTVNKSAKAKTQKQLKAYEELHIGDMHTLMEARGLGDLYNEILARQVEFDTVRNARAKRTQNSILIMGCAGIGTIVLMMLAVFLIIGLQLAGR
ncbi:MAG: hypothetical protein ABIQ44_12390 [Chloroflexia bacterium]